MENLSNIRVAIADDHQLVRAGLVSLIHGETGFEVNIEADNGKQLLEKIAQAKQMPDICIVDINIPIMNGHDTVLHLKMKWPEIKIMALTFDESEQSILRMFKNGANGYLLKTAAANTFIDALRDVYKQDYYFSAAVQQKFPKISAQNIAQYYKQLFSEKERQFLGFCCSDMSYEQIATKMCLSKRTVEKYTERIGGQVGLHGRIELALYAQMCGMGTFQTHVS